MRVWITAAERSASRAGALVYDRRMDGHRTAERRSLAYHAAIADRLHGEPWILDRARAQVAAWRRGGSVHDRYIAAWDAVLAGSAEEIAAALIDAGAAMIALRQVSPFTGVLGARERWAIWRRTA